MLVSCGGKHSIFNLFQAFLDEGDEVVIPSPYWVSYPAMVRLSGGTPRIVDTDERTGFKMTAEAFARSITKKTKAVVINSPSNPTGCVYSPDELKTIAEVALKNSVFIISDEIYEKLTYGEVPFISVASISEEVKKNSIVLERRIKDLFDDGLEDRLRRRTQGTHKGNDNHTGAIHLEPRFDKPVGRGRGHERASGYGYEDARGL